MTHAASQGGGLDFQTKHRVIELYGNVYYIGVHLLGYCVTGIISTNA